MHREDGNGFLRDQALDFFRVDGIVLGVDIAENRDEIVADDGMGGGGKGEGRCDDLAALGKLHGRNHVFQGQMPVCIQHHMRTAEILLQHLLQLFMLHAHIGQPMAVPEFFDFLAILLIIRH